MSSLATNFYTDEILNMLGKEMSSLPESRLQVAQESSRTIAFVWNYSMLIAQNPDTSVKDCNNFPLLIVRAPKFGPKKIYLVLNMTKDSSPFFPLFPSRN